MKAILFDFDGVIVNSYETNYQCQKKRFPGITREDHKKFFEGNVHQIREELVAKGKLQEDKTVDHHKIMREYFLTQQKMEKDILLVLKKLKEKFDLFIVSSFNEKYIGEFLEKHNMNYLFTQIMGLETHKKKVDKFNLLFEKYNYSVKDCIFVTDTLGDILEANKVNLKTIALDCGFHERFRLEKGKPHKIVSSFNELYEIIKTNNKTS